jgi:glyoxylase I family protein
MPGFERVLHAGLTVRDMRASAAWYRRVLGFQFVKEFKGEPDEPGIPRILLLHPGSGFLVGLFNHPGRSGDSFSPLRTGLDHLALEVKDEGDLELWIVHLDECGVEHSPFGKSATLPLSRSMTLMGSSSRCGSRASPIRRALSRILTFETRNDTLCVVSPV